MHLRLQVDGAEAVGLTARLVHHPAAAAVVVVVAAVAAVSPSSPVPTYISNGYEHQVQWVKGER